MIVLWHAFITAILISGAHASGPRCQELFVIKNQSLKTETVDLTFRELFQSKKTYRCLECHGNIKRFLLKLKHQNPNLRWDEFRVLYITHKDFPTEPGPDVGFHVKKARGSLQTPEHTEYVFWNFHVVVEFRGKIYDLDFTDTAQPLYTADYVDQFFISKNEQHDLQAMDGIQLEGSTSDLVVFVIPASSYVNSSFQDLNSWDYHLSLYTHSTSVPLLQFLRPN